MAETISTTSWLSVKSLGMKLRRLERRMMLKRPTMTAAQPATFAEVLAASASVAPIKLAMRVLAAMERGKGIWNVREVRVARTDWAASAVTPK